MKSLVIMGKQDLRLVDQPIPQPADGQVRVKVAYVGICGSDLHYYFLGANGTFVVKEPLTPGHEVSGVIDEDPAGQFAPGTPVTIHPATFGPDIPGLSGDSVRHLRPGGSYLGSASTWPHTQGAMAEYLVVGSDMIRPLPASVSLKDAALAEPLGVVLHGMANTKADFAGAQVLVCGAGPIGLLAVFAAKQAGAASVTATDVLTGPLERARSLGADQVIQIGVDQIPADHFDIVLECVGVTDSVNDALAAAKPRGVIGQIGMLPAGELPVTLAKLVNKELTMVGTFRFNDEIDKAVAVIAANPAIGQVTTHVFPADDAEQGFIMAKDAAASGKVMIAF